MISHREAETLRALERQAKPSTGAEIGRQLHELGVIDNYARAHQLLDALRTAGLAVPDASARPQRWTITEGGLDALSRTKPTLQSVLAEYGVRIVPTNAQRGSKQTHATATLEKLWQDGRGEAHLRDVLVCILESENNGRALTHPIITATSSLLKNHPAWWQRDASRWLGVYDGVNLLDLERLAKGNVAAVSVPSALTHELYRRLAEVFGPAQVTLFGGDL